MSHTLKVIAGGLLLLGLFVLGARFVHAAAPTAGMAAAAVVRSDLADWSCD